MRGVACTEREPLSWRIVREKLTGTVTSRQRLRGVREDPLGHLQDSTRMKVRNLLEMTKVMTVTEQEEGLAFMKLIEQSPDPWDNLSFYSELIIHERLLSRRHALGSL